MDVRHTAAWRDDRGPEVKAGESSTKTTGDALERLVAQHYEALGYTVVSNVLLAEHQIDLLATRYVTGGGTYTVMVESKHRTAPLGINEVTPFFNTAADLLRLGKIQAAVLVSDAPITEKARGAALQRDGVTLRTLQELQQDLFNYTESLLKAKLEYEASNTFREYIPLRGRFEDTRAVVPDIVEWLVKWAAGDAPMMVLAGDFGSGKSTLLRRAYYEQAKRRLADSRARYPIFLRLGKLLQHGDVWNFVNAALKDGQHISPPQSIFEAELNAGKLVLFLDGFDEIHTGANASDRALYLSRLAPLLASKSPCVLSTRPTYFESLGEMTELFTATLAPQPQFARVATGGLDISRMLRKLDLEPGQHLPAKHLHHVMSVQKLGDSDVLEYLKRFASGLRLKTGLSPEDAKAKLYKIYDLRDLMSRPLLLHMLVTTIVEGGGNILDATTPLGPASIYELYTQLCVIRDYEKWGGNQVLSRDDRLRVSRAVAQSMLRNGVLELPASAVREALEAANVPYLTDAEPGDRIDRIDRALTDIRVCSFLTQSDEGGGLRFAHKSYFEFFVAQAAILAWQQDFAALGRFAAYSVGKEIVYFLGSYARDQDSLGRMVKGALRSGVNEAGALGGLLRRILFASGTLLSDAELQGGRVESVEMVRASPRNTALRGIRLDGVQLRDAQLVEWHVQDCVCRHVTIEDCLIRGGDFAIEAEESLISQTVFEDCRIGLSGTWATHGARINRGQLKLDGYVFATASEVIDCEQTTLGPSLSIRGSGSLLFRSCRVFQETTDSWYDDTPDISFERCLLGGVRIEVTDLLGLADAHTQASVSRVRLHSCRGVVITEDSQGLFGSREQQKLRQRFANVDIFDIVAVEAQMRAFERRTVSDADDRERFPGLFALSAALDRHQLRGHVTGLLALAPPT